MRKSIFECKRCGYCCQGETTVSLDASDVENMQKCLDISSEELFKKYLRVTGNVTQMNIVDGHCIFFSDNGCSVHLGRPARCRVWPLHPSILVDEVNLKSISESCPGINKDVTASDFIKEMTS